jgi:hypothetical protein
MCARYFGQICIYKGLKISASYKTLKLILSSNSIGKNALFEPQPSLEDSVRFVCRESDHPVFISLDFATRIFLQSKVVSLASNPQPGGPGPCIYVPQ